MRGRCTAILTTLLLACWVNPLMAATPRELLARIKAVGTEGKGNPAARQAWRELVEIGPAALVPILKEFDDRHLVVVNWLRPAVDAIAERAARASQKLPVAELEPFLADRANPAMGRRVAYELLVRVDPATPDRWLPKLLDDPSFELRRDAVARVLSDGEKLVEKPVKLAGLALGPIASLPPAATFVPPAQNRVARAVFKKALTAACDEDQIDACADQLEALGDKVDLAKHYGFVRAWALVAPFDNVGGVGFAAPYAPEKGVDLKATYTGKAGKKVAWGSYASTNSRGIIDLKAAFGNEKGAVGYAFTVIDSPKERPIEIRLGSFNATKILLNGHPVFAHEEYHHGMNIDQYSCRAMLKAGKNELLVKVCQNEQTEPYAQVWRFQLRLCDATGAAVPFTVVAPAVPPVGKSRSRGDKTAPGSFSLSPLLLVSLSCYEADDWTGFRGSRGLSTSPEKNLPTKWSQTEGLKWKVALPGRGLSNPVIAGGRIFVTAVTTYRERRLVVLCFEQATGKKLWERQFTATGPTGCHPMTNMAAPTPVTDGKNVYAQFATGDVVGLDRDGNMLWYRSLVTDYPTVTNQVGMASSPVLAGGLLVVPMENDGESFLAGLDLKTGENIWKTARPRSINWVTPLATKIAGKDAVIFHGTKDVTAYEPATGKVMWTLPVAGASTIPSSTAGGGMLFVPGREFLALKPTKADETPEVVWRSPRLPLGFTSPVYHDGRIYGLTRVGVVCVDARTGKSIWQQRLEGSFAASPLLADGKLYVVNQEGTTTVLQLGGDTTPLPPKILARSELDDTILATPAVVDGCLYLRSDKFLYCVGPK